jgi:hypothetical protein
MHGGLHLSRPPFRRFLGDVGREFFMARSFSIVVMHCMRVVQLLLHASLLRGLKDISFFASHFFTAPLLLAVDSTAFLVIYFDYL